MTETLDEKFQQWLKENNAEMIIIAQALRTKEIVSIEAFVTPTGVQVPAGWALGVTLIEAKNGANRTD